MTEFVKDELCRVMHKLTETDPSTPNYHYLLQSIECLNGIADTIDAIAMIEDATNCSPVADTPLTTIVYDFSDAVDAQPPNAIAPTKTYDKSEVRAACIEAKKRGADLKDLFSKYGASDFGAVNAEDYSDLMTDLGVYL